MTLGNISVIGLIYLMYWNIAQLGEHTAYTRRVAGSSPAVPIWLMQDQGQMHPFRPAGNVTISGA